VPETLRRVGRYEIVKEVGRGGMAVVYLARQSDLDRNVALKELAAFHAADRVLVDRFVRESRVAGSLSHPNIVTVHDFFEHDNIPFIAMEYIERGSLRQLMPGLTASQIAGVLEAVLAGLAHAARHGVVHRDLKPENLMVTAEGTVKIADFGIARALNSLTARLTATGTAIGTPAYMAPEQATGDEVGPWTDLYSLGIVAYELLVGEVPFQYDEPMRILLRHVNDEVPPPRQQRPDLDPRMSEWVQWLLRKDPSERPASAVEAWEALEEIVIALLGPRWRRGARLLGAGGARETAQTPTPARFPGGTTEPSGDGDDSRWAPTTASPVSGPAAGPSVPTAAADGRIDAAVAPFATPAGVTRPAEAPAERRRLLFIGVGAAVVVAALIAASLVALSGGGEGSPSGSPLPDNQPKPGERIGLAAAAGSLYLSDPRGRVVRASPRLQKVAAFADPARPKAVAVTPGRVYVSDASAVYALHPRTLAPVGAVAFRGAVALASAPSAGFVAAVRADGGRGRVCQIPVGAVAELRCAPVPFAPTGVGVAAGWVYVANGKGGTVVPYVPRGKKLAPRKPISIGRGTRPAGTLVAEGTRLYVAVERGVAVVALPGGRVARRVELPVTPASISATRRGAVLAALYATNQLAVISGSAPPRLFKVARRPVAVASDAKGQTAYVAGAGTRCVEAIRIDSGRATRASTALLAGAAPKGTHLGGPKLALSGRSIAVSIGARGGALDQRALRIGNLTISDGGASFQLLAGGLAAAGARVTRSGLTVVVHPAPGGARVEIRSTPGTFVSMSRPAARVRGVTFSVTKPAPRPATSTTPPQQTQPQQSTPAPSPGGSGITIG
jgi:DNA-binding beta-propeller fold protein YncE